MVVLLVSERCNLSAVKGPGDDFGASHVLAERDGARQSVSGLHKGREVEQYVPRCVRLLPPDQAELGYIGRGTERSARGDSARPCAATAPSWTSVRLAAGADVDS